jgi:pyruvate formate lyase activating enzyme
MKEVCANLDAVKIDLKAFSNEYYKDICRGELQPVLNTLKLLKQEDVWFEIVYLMVPTLNDDKEELTKMCDWIVENLGEDVPLHFSRFHPQYKLKNLPATPKKTLNMAYEVAQNAGLNYVYVGNVPGHKGESTFCPNCGKAVIKRIGFRVVENDLNDGKCKFCDTEIAGIWK